MDEAKVTERILERTGDRFFTEGLSVFTMDDVARDSGVSKKTLYRLIPSKDDLILRVVSRQIDKVKRKQDAILANAELSYQEKLNELMKTVSGILGRIGRKTMQDMMRIHPDLWEMIRRRRQELLHGMSSVLEEGQEAGIIRTDIPTAFVARYFQQIVDTMVTPQIALEADMTPNQMLETVLTMFLDGVTTRTEGRMP